MTHIRLPIQLILLALAIYSKGSAADASVTYFTEVDVRGVSESMAVLDTIDGFEGDLNEGGDFAYTHNEARIGARRGKWAVSVYSRYDYYLDFDPDTAKLLHQRANDIEVETERSYRIDLDAQHASGVGISMDYTFNITPSFELTTRASLLRAYDVLDGSITGNIDVAADGSYSGSAQVHYFYGEDYLFNRPNVEQPNAWGGTLDLFVQYRINDRFTVRAQVEDAYSRVEWKDAPVTIATANSARNQVNSDGLLDVQPILSGLEAEQDFEQSFPQRYRALVDYSPGNAFSWQLQGDLIQGRHFYRVNSTYFISEKLKLDFAAAFQTRALGIGIRYRGFEIFILSDDINFSKSRALELRCNYQIAL